eukprot:c33472_g1_i1.p1 GENE.c33472_g1_i1~~c33472_g1_i1.p1  ORF type:complete len:420 (+),score=86.00 c33472_g1_i1:156-1262(+)
MNRPVLIKGMVNHWPAIERWKHLDNLRELAGDEIVTVDLTPTGYADAIVDDRLLVTPAQVRCTLNTFLSRIDPSDHEYCPPSQCVHYVSFQNSNLTEELHALLPAVEPSLNLGDEAFGTAPDAVNIWMGQEQAVTSLHKDHYENLYAVVSGRKIFTLFSPPTHALLYEKSYTLASYHCQGDKSSSEPNTEFDASRTANQLPKLRSDFKIVESSDAVPWISVDPIRPDFEKYPLFRHAHAITVTVEAGDVLYIPALFYHHVMQRQSKPGHPAIAVNYWYDMQFDLKYAYYMLVRRLTTNLNSTKIQRIEASKTQPICNATEATAIEQVVADNEIVSDCNAPFHIRTGPKYFLYGVLFSVVVRLLTQKFR